MFRRTPAIALLAFSLVACAQSSGDEDASSSGAPAVPVAGGASCQGHCDGASEDDSCKCDAACEMMGDCCTDYAAVCSGEPAGGGAGGAPNPSGGTSSGGAPAGGGGMGGSGATGGVTSGGTGGVAANPGSCAGHCGGPSADGSCYCDAACQQSGDCCADVAQCGTTGATTGGCTAALCGTDKPANENGVECYCDPSCMLYGDCCSNTTTVCGF